MVQPIKEKEIQNFSDFFSDRGKKGLKVEKLQYFYPRTPWRQAHTLRDNVELGLAVESDHSDQAAVGRRILAVHPANDFPGT